MAEDWYKKYFGKTYEQHRRGWNRIKEASGLFAEEEEPEQTAETGMTLDATLERWPDGHVARLTGAEDVYGRGGTPGEALADLKKATLFALGGEE